MLKIGTVRVGSVDYAIIEATPRERRVLSEAVGACNVHTATILVRRGLAEGVKLETIGHEIGHAIFFGSGAREYQKTVLAKGKDPHEVEEMLLQILTPMVLTVKGELLK